MPHSTGRRRLRRSFEKFLSMECGRYAIRFQIFVKKLITIQYRVLLYYLFTHPTLHSVTGRQDMNEPSNFVDGSDSGCTTKPEEAGYALDHPPYTPPLFDAELASRTVCPSARHAAGTHYDLHNLYSYTETVVSHKCVTAIRFMPLLSDPYLVQVLLIIIHHSHYH